ncbi:MAG: type II toxin-antitoxin system VapC family toxin [Deltaproteobacteria bacterium]|nr:MAG: type II toxin-antitoxin system VapC family toxin [Deltaproteobacteria bacterium]
MKICFIDTNLFIRYLTNDDPQKADRVDRLLEQAAKGKVKLMTAEIVLAEVVWVLESYYKLENVRIAEILKAILSTPGLEILNGKIVEKALQYYLLKNIDFVDAYIVALMKKHKVAGIYSFDKKHLDRITHVTRLEP